MFFCNWYLIHDLFFLSKLCISFIDTVIGLKYFSNTKGLFFAFRALSFAYCLIVCFCYVESPNDSSLYIVKKVFQMFVKKLLYFPKKCLEWYL